MTAIGTTNSARSPDVRSAIAQAAARTGVDFDYLVSQARIESSLNPDAKARTSSAAGLFQFTRQTWLQVVKDHGSDHGLAWAADAITRTGKGLSVSNPAMQAAIERLRYDPALSSAMAAEFAADNRDQLEAGLGRSAEPVDLYLAHFLGSAGALTFLKASADDPNAAAAPLLPAAAAANHAIFYDASGAARSLGEIRSNFTAKLQNGGLVPGAQSASISTLRTSTLSPERAPLRMAEIKPMPRTLSLEFAAQTYQRMFGDAA